MFAVGDWIVVVDTGETGVVTEVLGLGCYMVRLVGWQDDCQVHERMLALHKAETGE